MERAIRLNRNATSQIMDVLVELRNAPGSGDGKRHEVDPESLDRIIRLLQFEDLSSQAQAKAVAAVDQACAAIDALESGELQRKLVEEAIAEWWRNYREDCQHDLEEGGVELFDQSQDTQ